MTDLFAEARNRMVDSQIRPNRVIDPRITGAMRRLPRERFLPADQAPLAYADQDVPLGNGRVLMQPMAIARLVQLAAPMQGEHALVVGAGVGYGAALLAACGPRVTALEEDPALLAIARHALTEFAPEVSVVSGPLAAGWPAGAPYDVILLEGAVQTIPPAVAGQLRNNGGRLVTVVCAGGRTSHAVLAEATGVGLRAQPMFDCATPPLPSLLPAPAFAF
jgi:protein-L-isoaspartate(D-aspartate) O-methyltransferase